jgi:hypothetical protein
MTVSTQIDEILDTTAVTVRDIPVRALDALRPLARRRGYGGTNAGVVRMAMCDSCESLKAAATMHCDRTNAAAVAYAVDRTIQSLAGNGKPTSES